MDTWELNSNWRKLQKPVVGDIVHLKLSDDFEYLVKALVMSVSEEIITVKIEALFDWQNRSQITGGDKTSRVGEVISFNLSFIQKVIKKSTTDPDNPIVLP